MLGDSKPRKSLAKRSAAFNACVKLIEAKYLDDRFISTFAKHRPAMRNAALSLKLHEGAEHILRTKSTLWHHMANTTPGTLFMINFDACGNIGQPYQSIAVLARSPFPSIPQFPIYPSGESAYMTKSLSFEEPIIISDDDLKLLNFFTFTIFEDVFNKHYERDPKMMPYWLAPTRKSVSCVAKEIIDWQTLRAIHDNQDSNWRVDMPHSMLENKFFVDQWHGGRRYFSAGVCGARKPLDPAPLVHDGSKTSVSILEFSVSHKKADLSQFNPLQPVIEAERLLHRRNMLAKADTTEALQSSKCYICPEPLKISAVSIFLEIFEL